MIGHEWEQTAWEYDDSFFRCRRCGLEVNQKRGIPAPDDFGVCAPRMTTLTREDFDRARASGRVAEAFEKHFDALSAFLCAASGHPRVTLTPDDCCDRCGAPERAFRAAVRLLYFAEKS